VTEVVLLNGTVGAGKTTVAEALSELDREQGVPHAVLDLDGIRRLWPSPEGDPFQLELELQNLGCVAANFRRAGARHLILAGVLESPAELPRYRHALGTADLLVCRLTVDASTAHARLSRRHADDPAGLAWHLERTGRLADILERADLNDVVVDTTGLTPREVAQQVRRAARW